MSDTPKRTVRVPDELWESARLVAEADELTVSQLIRALLRGYIVGRRDA